MNLKAVGLLFGVAAVAIAVGAGDAVAQPRCGGRGPMHYDAAAEVTVKGTVKNVGPGPGQGVHVMLETPEGTRELALGPSWYQTEKKYELAKGDELEAVRARSHVDGRDVPARARDKKRLPDDDIPGREGISGVGRARSPIAD